MSGLNEAGAVYIARAEASGMETRSIDWRDMRDCHGVPFTQWGHSR